MSGLGVWYSSLFICLVWLASLLPRVMEEVIKLPVANEKPKAKKRPRKPKYNPEAELIKRGNHVKDLAVLGEEDASVKLLEDLVFGAEDELEERLIEVGPLIYTAHHNHNELYWPGLFFLTNIECAIAILVHNIEHVTPSIDIAHQHE